MCIAQRRGKKETAVLISALRPRFIPAAKQVACWRWNALSSEIPEQINRRAVEGLPNSRGKAVLGFRHRQTKTKRTRIALSSHAERRENIYFIEVWQWSGLESRRGDCESVEDRETITVAGERQGGSGSPSLQVAVRRRPKMVGTKPAPFWIRKYLATVNDTWTGEMDNMKLLYEKH